MKTVRMMKTRVIFGGKQNFYKRLKGNITNEEWKDLRSNQLYARGDKSKKRELKYSPHV
ncbi:hypothetical protein [Parageobacillus thermoglucosidasius]|uniref:hypothetical protein n=1 Tax=Parageobacillus thermoglucosidasius TaxID=1426 RepID=UPI0016254A97|nr:hypothetical protein [Parageobacillus thermoglucosidasius]